MITCIFGAQGSGKTLLLAKLGKKAHLKGKTVYSNFKVNYPYTQLKFSDLEDCNLNNAVVLLDEAHIWGLDARSSMSKTNKKLTANFIPQVRKQGVNLFCSTQYPRQLDVRVRDNADFFYWIKKYLYNNGVIKRVVQSSCFDKKIPLIIEVNFVRIEDEREGHYFFIANDYYNLYSTSEVVKLKK